MCYVPNTSKCCFFFLFSLSPFFPLSTPVVAHYRCDAILKTTLLPSLGPITLGYSCFAWALKLRKLRKKRKKIWSLFAGPCCATARVKKHAVAALFWQAVIEVIKQFVAAPTINRFCRVPMNSLLCKRNSIRLDSTVQLALYCIGCHCHFYTVKHLVFHSPLA